MTLLHRTLFCLLLALPSFGNQEKWLQINPATSLDSFDWRVLPPDLTPEMIKSLHAHPVVSSERDPIQILWVKDKIWAVFPCRLSVLEWQGTQWVDLYKGYSAGFNCQAQFFIRNGILHSYGRYGYWHTHSEILLFDPKDGGWENIRAENMPVHFAGIGVYLHGNNLIAFLGQRIHQARGLFEFYPDGYYYSFSDHKWLPVHSTLREKPRHFDWMDGRVFDLKDFGIQHYDYKAELGFLVVNKKDLTLHFKKINHQKFDEFALVYGEGNRLVAWDERGQATVLNLKEPLDKAGFIPLGQLEVASGHGWIHSFRPIEWVYFWIILGVFFLGLLWWWRRTKPLEPIVHLVEVEDQDEVQGVLDILLANRGATLDMDAFDALLRLDSIDNMDYRRVRRSRLIRSLNEVSQQKWGIDIILRSKSPEDRRIMQYQIVGPQV